MAKKEYLRISEDFYSLQGEGRTMGIPAVFVRLQACNILCKGEWVCDTIDVWRKGEKSAVIKWVEYMSKYHLYLSKGAHLIFTGGEPLLQQDSIVFAIKYFTRVYGYKPYIEIETNGTIVPSDDLIALVDLFNCSFKLENSGVKFERRIKLDALRKINKQHSIFKIVVGSRMDYLEAKKIFDVVGTEKKDIYLMPPADDIESLNKMQLITSEICIQESVNFSSRLQVALWNKTTGV